MSDAESGLSRVSRIEKNNQRDAGGTSGKWVSEKIKLPRGTKSNPKKGGGINRSLKSN